MVTTFLRLIITYCRDFNISLHRLTMKIATHLVLLTSLALSSASLHASSTQPIKNRNGWLTAEQDPKLRLQKLETYLRGFDQPMLETGQRYESMYQALMDNNLKLAAYQWKKIRTTIENGLMKRPKRERNAKLLLLDAVWEDVMTDLTSNEPQRALIGFNKAKAACMSCHQAENKGFINNQPMFRLGQ